MAASPLRCPPGLAAARGPRRLTPTMAPGGAPPGKGQQGKATRGGTTRPPAATPGGAPPGGHEQQPPGGGAPPTGRPHAGGRAEAHRPTPPERGRHAAGPRAARLSRYCWPARFAGAGYPVAPTHQPPGAILRARVPPIIP